MALDGAHRSVTPESSGRNSPVPRQWRNQLGVDDAPAKDKHYRKYASGVDRALSLFDTALQEWADYISFLNRLLRALQARPPSITTIPVKVMVAKRLAQCMNPSLPSGVHQKALEVYSYIFSVVGREGLSRDLPLYLSGLAATLSFASLSVRTPFLDLLEKYMLDLDARALRPAMKSIVLALLPGLEEENSEDFERTFTLMQRFKFAIRPPDAEEITAVHSTGDGFFWQCFFLASITGQSRRPGALAYLVRDLPKLGHVLHATEMSNGHDSRADAEMATKLSELVTTPEPGLLLRCFAAGMADEQLLMQRGFLDLVVTHLPLHSQVLQARAKPADVELLMGAASGVTIRRDMSLNRRLWTWLLGPEPAAEHDGEPDSPATPGMGGMGARTNYFEEFGLQPLTRALLSMIKQASDTTNPAERARPFRICLSLMDRWEIGGLVVPEVFLPVVDSVRAFHEQASTKADFAEVLRSASVFFDGVESGLIYSEILSLMAQAIGPGALSTSERSDKMELVQFILRRFNVREEEMVTVHAPLTVLSVLCMLEEIKEREKSSKPVRQVTSSSHVSKALVIAADLLELVPDRAFPAEPAEEGLTPAIETKILVAMPNVELLRKIRTFYVSDQGNLEQRLPPFASQNVAELLLQKAFDLNCEFLECVGSQGADAGVKSRMLMLLLSKTPRNTAVDARRLLSALHECLVPGRAVPFVMFSSVLALATHMYSTDRIAMVDLSDLVPPLVRQAWTFLSSADPKYHVETVRNLWQLQSALTTSNRDVEAAICSLILEKDTAGTFAARPADGGRRFSVLWTHSLQDNAHGSERRGSRATPLPTSRLSGVEHYHVMLTRPVFLMLDSLTDDRTQLFMTVKSWLNTLVGTEQLFAVFVSKLAELAYLRTKSSAGPASATVDFGENDDLDLGMYYLRTLSNVLRWAPDHFWPVLATKLVAGGNVTKQALSEVTGTEGDVYLHEFFLHACLRVLDCMLKPQEKHTSVRVTQLYRSALTVLHQLLLSPFAERFSAMHLEDLLIDRLSRCLDGPDGYVQVLLLDVVFAALKLRELVPVSLPASPTHDKQRAVSLDPVKMRSVTSGEASSTLGPPAALLGCMQAGLGSPNSRPVLDSWVLFLNECLPLYSDSMFQVLMPLVETLCSQIGSTWTNLQTMFRTGQQEGNGVGPETTLISLLNGLEQVLAKAHDRLLAEEARAQASKTPEQPQGFFGNMVSGVFAVDTPAARSATANHRLTVLLAFQDAVRMCFTIWSWGQGGDEQDASSAASFMYTSLRMRNRARRLLEHLFAAETLECLETVMGIWKATSKNEVLNLLPALDGSRPKHTVPALFNAIYSRTNPSALDGSRRSALTMELRDTDVVTFLVDYARSLEDDAMDEIWQDCMAFLRDLLGNPFPYRQTLPSLLEFAAILGEKVDNTNFGEQRKMRRDLADLFMRLLTAMFTARPPNFADAAEKKVPGERAEDVVGILARAVPNLLKILVDNDRVLAAAAAISANVIGPALRSRAFPDTVSRTTLVLLQELARLPNNQRSWKKDVADAFNDARFFGSDLALVETGWLPLLRQWTVADKERMPELLARITPPTTAGIVFGVGATSARLEADRRTQLNLRRMATLVLAAPQDTFVPDLSPMLEKLVELLAATPTSSPSSTTRADVFMLARAMVLRTTPSHLAALWPVVNAELHAALASAAAPDHTPPADTYAPAAVLQACKLLDLLVCAAPDDFQLHAWLFITDTVDAVYRDPAYQPVALVDELADELGPAVLLDSTSRLAALPSSADADAAAAAAATAGDLPLRRRPLLGPGGLMDHIVAPESREELLANVLRPFLGQLSMAAFEATYAMTALDEDACLRGLLADLFDEPSIVKAL